MNPVPVMKLVEVIRAIQTTDATAKFVHDLAADLGKTTAESRDVPGLYRESHFDAAHQRSESSRCSRASARRMRSHGRKARLIIRWAPSSSPI